ncbi:D-alanyl-D-alanine endopeptidase [Bordetella bronchialis]|uniref:D-alanyl-D-alanine carboxypeptidase n=2 Tax=Bordetella bronchialis TaxID=463025 RepID=A0A193FFF6_9BORD|nr:D-alanyl-D-alanine endopeptidase [Bordetella bronchialis]ANN65926.1 D-alanyl-D-alanine carboxypeptidase [Bordetella bronchialis]ANN71010.1 D-alanyl-D-alanine carboxypeptidase [Bordetella bronchialis]
MAQFVTRSVVTAVAPLMVAASLLLSPGARAAADPCKVNAKSAACKAAQAKTAPKQTTTTTVTKSTTTAKSGSKTTVAKTQSKTTTVAKKSASGKTSTTTRKETVADTTTKSGKKVVSHATSTTRSKVSAAAAPATTSAQAAALRSSVAYVQDLATSTVLFSKNEDTIRPIASISKLMTALVVVDANQPMDDMLEVTDDDIDRLRHAASRLPVGSRLSRADMLHVALMSSENRAAHALGRYYPGGMPAFVKAMNAKARELGMMDTHFVEPTGLSSENVSSPRDLVRLLRAASQRPLIHRYTTDTEYDVDMGRGQMRTFRNTNALVRSADWDIKVSKTGFINEAGECLVMLAHIQGRDLAIVLLDSQGKYSRIADAVRIRKFVQNEVAMM